MAPEEIDQPPVKDALRTATQAAIEAGVFGVPTCEIGGQLIWGFESTDMVLARIDDDPFFESPGWLAARQVGEGVQRKT